MSPPDCALVFPPLWYFAAVPGDLSHAAGFLGEQGLEVEALDLSTGANHALLGSTPGWQALRDPATCGDHAAALAARDEVRARARALGSRFGARYNTRSLVLEGAHPEDLGRSLAIALDPRKNPLLPWLTDQARRLTDLAPRLVGIAACHPDQLVFGPALGRLLRQAGYTGTLVLYGGLEDVLSPADLVAELGPDHLLFEDFDAVLPGEPGPALLAALRGKAPAQPPWEAPDALPDFSWVEPAHHPFPTPVVDLHAGRGCPWGRCAFCAMGQRRPHQLPSAQWTLRAMERAHAQLGSTAFRIRDDLVSPSFLVELAGLVRARLPQARWTARARIHPRLSAPLLAEARAGGLQELWVGLESAVPRVRELMDKGVDQEHVLGLLRAAREAGVRVRLLCLLGHPGESLDEARQTLDFLVEHQHLWAGISLTPFELMRSSPVGQRPNHWGIQLTPDPLPRHRRLRYHLPTSHAPDLRALFPRLQALAALRAPTTAGPDPSHDWLLEDRP